MEFINESLDMDGGSEYSFINKPRNLACSMMEEAVFGKE
jgi:hypothetical protein